MVIHEVNSVGREKNEDRSLAYSEIVCVRKIYTHTISHIHTHTHTYIHTYFFTEVCV